MSTLYKTVKKYLHHRWGPIPVHRPDPAEKRMQSVGTDQPPHELREKFPPRCQTTENRAPRSFLEIGQCWDDLKSVLPWKLLCVGISYGAECPLQLTFPKGRARSKGLGRTNSVWHIDLGKYVYTLRFFGGCFHFPTKWSLLTYSTGFRCAVGRAAVNKSSGCWTDLTLHFCKWGIRERIRHQKENLSSLSSGQTRLMTSIPFFCTIKGRLDLGTEMLLLDLDSTCTASASGDAPQPQPSWL